MTKSQKNNKNMKKLISWFVDNFDKIYILILFSIAFMLIVYLFPTSGKWYEFQKGQPWLHKDLIAPFDFAVSKMDNELTQEKKEILLNFAPYFDRKNIESNKKLKQFEKEFHIKFYELKSKTDSATKLQSNSRQQLQMYDSLLSYYNIVFDALKHIYKEGILEPYEDYENINPESGLITILNQNVAEQRMYNSLFTQKSAYKYVIAQLNNRQTNSNEYVELIKSMQINNYIVPTLFYNIKTSEKAKKELIDAISLTKGMVQKGERIISRGEMIDNDKFRILESLKKEYISSLDSKTNSLLIFSGRFILILFAFLVLYVFLSSFKNEVIKSRRKTLFILSLIILFVFISNIIYRVEALSIYIIPFAILPILINTFFDSRLALFVYIVTILLTAFYAPNSFEFVFIHIIAGSVAIMALKDMQKRGEFFSAIGLTTLSYFLLYFGMSMNQEGNFENIEWINFAWFAGNGILLFLSFPMIYFVEKSFKFLSDITLMELSDTNQKLLRNLAENAPGTFQHSMQVANLAEEVTRNIGGNPLLVRTGALYHDIGKLANAEYFTENQISGENPHDNLSYIESAEMIISHTIIGIEMAKKAKLPQQVIDFIQTHHGTSKVQYFFRLYKKENPDGEKDADKFTYPGPKPFSKEMAVLMMSDSIEAASRSLKEYSRQTIENLVEGIINYQIKEEQFDNANINFAEITKAKAIFKNKLQNIYHARIEYPKEE